LVDPRVFRTYDIRAIVPELVDESSVYFRKVGADCAYQSPLEPDGVEEIGRGLAGLFGSDTVAIGRDSRLSSPAWGEALVAGFISQGVNVIDLGLTSTDMVYFVSGKYNVPAVQITASHCTKELNGMKMVRAGANVVGQGSGMEELRDLVIDGNLQPAERKGGRTPKNVMVEYIDHLVQLVDPKSIRPFNIIADAGNGVGGLVAEELLDRFPQVSSTRMYFEPDGNFPNHEVIARIPRDGADFGVAWDGDADRVYFLDENGRFIPGDFVTALVARFFLDRSPGSAIVYDIRSSWAVREWVLRMGGRPIQERVGHSFIKQTMRGENAVFGGEVSGHYYFRDHFYADNGFIPLLVMMKLLTSDECTMSALVSGLGDYHLSGEINSTVSDIDAVMVSIAAKYEDADEINYMDGITITYQDWHFNVRPSANDPVLRLNLEARSQAQMELRRDEVLNLIRNEQC
jgi:phosphomannomutase